MINLKIGESKKNMSKKLSKSTNRLLSVLYLTFFGVSIAFLGITSGILISTYIENKKLEEQLNREIAELEEIYKNVGEDGYYNVYSNGEYVIYGSGGSIIIVK